MITPIFIEVLTTLSSLNISNITFAISYLFLSHCIFVSNFRFFFFFAEIFRLLWFCILPDDASSGVSSSDESYELQDL